MLYPVSPHIVSIPLQTVSHRVFFVCSHVTKLLNKTKIFTNLSVQSYKAHKITNLIRRIQNTICSLRNIAVIILFKHVFFSIAVF